MQHITAQIAGNEVVYSVVLTKAKNRLVVKRLKAISKSELSKK